MLRVLPATAVDTGRARCPHGFHQGLVEDYAIVHAKARGASQRRPAHHEAARGDVAEQGNGRYPLRHALSLQTSTVRNALAAPHVILRDSHLQPRPDPSQQPPVTQSRSHAGQQFGMRNLRDSWTGPRPAPPDRMCSAADACARLRPAHRPVGARLRLPDGLEDRPRHRCCRHLHDPITPIADSGQGHRRSLVICGLIPKPPPTVWEGPLAHYSSKRRMSGSDVFLVVHPAAAT